MSTLNLIVKRKWFDEIASGRKKIEYREFKPYWIKRLLTLSKDKKKARCGDFASVLFRAGYTKIAPTALLEFKKLTSAHVIHPDTGKQSYCFLIHLGKILEIKNWKRAV